jgi:hypothetical protein
MPLSTLPSRTTSIRIATPLDPLLGKNNESFSFSLERKLGELGFEISNEESTDYTLFFWFRGGEDKEDNHPRLRLENRRGQEVRDNFTTGSLSNPHHLSSVVMNWIDEALASMAA